MSLFYVQFCVAMNLSKEFYFYWETHVKEQHLPAIGVIPIGNLIMFSVGWVITYDIKKSWQ